MMNKTLINMAVAAVLPLGVSTAYAALPANAILNFDDGNYICIAGAGTYPNCTYGTNVLPGSYFAMDGDGSGTVEATEKVAIALNDGVRLGVLQPASGTHTGAPGCVPGVGTCNDTVPTSESPDIDMPWGFFNNTGLHQTTTAITIDAGDDGTGDGTASLDFAGWDVTWNGIPSIPMGGDTANFAGDTGVAIMTCDTDCSVGENFTLNYFAHVPLGDASGFGGVGYTLYLEGTIGECASDASAPNAVNDTYDVVVVDTLTSLAIAANDTDVGCSGLDKVSIDLDTVTAGQQTTVMTSAGGTATLNLTTGVVEYTSAPGYLGPDSFSYTISDRDGNPSALTTVDMTVVTLSPTCNDDGVAQGAYIDITTDASVNITVLGNDLDGSGVIDPTTVAIVNDVDVAEGATEIFTDGTITFTAAPGFTGTASFTYNVTDDGDPALTCADATVNVLVSAAGEPIGGVANAYMVLTSGTVDDNSQQPDFGEGSWFSMETSPGTFTYVPIVGLNHIQLGTEQPALSPDMPNIDSPWTFFGNLGVHQTTGILNQLSNDGVGNAQLDFSVWDVSWNKIASIPMGSGQDEGIATVTCYDGETDFLETVPGTCADDDHFLLTYRAIVPPGDPSGFGGVNYVIHLEGYISETAPIVGCGGNVTPPIPDPSPDVDTVKVISDCVTMTPLTLLPGSTATSVGNTTGLYLSASDIGSKDPLLNTADGEQCVGGCLDFVINEVITGEALLVVKLNAVMPEGAVYRKLVNGKWQDFDVSQGDEIGSGDSIAVDSATGLPIDDDVEFDPLIHEKKCQGPEGIYQIGLRSGKDCLFLRIADGGPNDADGEVNQTIVDPSGALLPGSPNVPASATGGCSISKTSVKLTERAEWFIIAGFIVWLGMMNYRRKKAVN